MAIVVQEIPKGSYFYPDETLLSNFSRGTSNEYRMIGWNLKDGRNNVSADFPIYNKITQIFDKSTSLYTCWSKDFVKIIFDANGGVASQTERYIGKNHPIGLLPTATKNSKNAKGWYTSTQESSGIKIESTNVFTNDSTLYAIYPTELTYDNTTVTVYPTNINLGTTTSTTVSYGIKRPSTVEVKYYNGMSYVTLGKGTDYTLSYLNDSGTITHSEEGTSIITAYALVDGTNEYSGQVSAQYTISHTYKKT